MARHGRTREQGLAVVADAVRSRLWPQPVAGIVLALAGAVALTGLDRVVDAELPASFRSWVFGGDASAARSVLSSIATAMMTVTSLTFSLTVVTLQLASSQYSPRLLRTFTQARYVQRTLALFLSTFVFTLTVLRSVRSDDAIGEGEFVPRISVTVTYALAVASVVGLVLFLAKLAESIRVESVLQTVHDEAEATARRTLTDATTLEGHLVAPDRPTVRLTAPRSGFVTGVAADRLVAVARELDVVVLIDAPVGAAVVAGTTVGRAWSAHERGEVGEEAHERLVAAVHETVRVGRERTAVDDVTFGLQQITDVAVKALSPGINDPTTAVHALASSASLLCRLVTLPLGDVVCADDDGQRRLVVRQADVGDVLSIALDEPRHFGVDDPAVVARLLQLLREVAESVSGPDARQAVRDQLDQLLQAWAQVDAEPAVRTRLERAATAAYAVLDEPGSR